LLKSVGWFVSASAAPPTFRGNVTALLGHYLLKKEDVRRVADEDMEVADE